VAFLAENVSFRALIRAPNGVLRRCAFRALIRAPSDTLASCQRLEDARAYPAPLERAVQDRIVDMVSAHHPIKRIARALHRRKHELPAKVASGARKLARQRKR